MRKIYMGLRSGLRRPAARSSLLRSRLLCVPASKELLSARGSAGGLSDRRILLVGEGDFSWARAFASIHKNADIVATSLEPEEDIHRQWGGESALRELHRMPHVKVIHGVDATSLMANERICDCVSTSAFDAALFLFPHCGMKGRIQKNRSLVEAFFSNVGSVLSTTGRVEVVLASGQGGTPLDGEAALIYGNTWMVALAAAEGGFVLSAAEPFDCAGWAALGYTSRGCWRGLGDSMQKGFRTGGAICHEFVREARGVASPFPLGWQMDASFWAPSHWRQQLQLAAVPSAERPLLGHCEAGWRHRGSHRPEPAADEPLECLRRAAAALLQERGVEVLDAQAVDVFEAPDGRLSACIRFTYVAARSALTRAGMVAAHTRVREGMGGAVPGVSLRTRLRDDDTPRPV